MHGENNYDVFRSILFPFSSFKFIIEAYKTIVSFAFFKNEIITGFGSIMPYLEAKGDWDFRISDVVKNPDGTDI